MRRLHPQEEIIVRDGEYTYLARVTRMEGAFVRPRIERKVAPEQLQLRCNCYGLDEIPRLVADLEDLADRAKREADRVRRGWLVSDADRVTP